MGLIMNFQQVRHLRNYSSTDVTRISSQLWVDLFWKLSPDAVLYPYFRLIKEEEERIQKFSPVTVVFKTCFSYFKK